MPSTISDYVGPARNDVSARASERSSRARAYFGQNAQTFHSPNDAGADWASNEADVSALERKSARVRVTFQEGARRLIG